MRFRVARWLGRQATRVLRRTPVPTMEQVLSSSILTYPSEWQFEEQVMVPLLKQWGLPVRRQVPCRLRSRTGISIGRIDMLIHTEDNATQLTLIENKRSIRTPTEQARAVAQANAYARARRLRTFVIAAPEGLWIYSRPGGKPVLQRVFTTAQIHDGALEAKTLLLQLHRRER